MSTTTNIKNSNSMKAFFYLFIMIGFYFVVPSVYSQDFNSGLGEFYSIKNKGSDVFLHGNINSNIPPRISLSKFGDNIINELKFDIYPKKLGNKVIFFIKKSDFYLSISPIVSVKENNESTSGAQPMPDPNQYRPDTDLSVSDGSQVKPYRVYSNYNITLDKLFQGSNSPAANVALTKEPEQQHWEFLPVKGESDTYYIFSTALKSDTVFLTSKRQGATFVLAIGTFLGGSNQKWVILPRNIQKPTQVAILGFEHVSKLDGWGKKYIEGTIRWKDNSDREEGYIIYMRREDNPNKNHLISKIGSDREGMSFKINSKYGRGKKHCFTVSAFSKWDTSKSEEVCDTPYYYNPPPPPPPPPPVGYKTFTLYNCHEENRKIYVYSFNNSTGEKIYHGILDRGSTTARSPCGRDKPLIINLKDGDVYTVYTYEEPNEQCRLSTFGYIKGDINGGNGEIIINTKCR